MNASKINAMLQLAAMHGDKTKFAGRVRELATAGDDNPIFNAAKQFPKEYGEWRLGQHFDAKPIPKPSAMTGRELAEKIFGFAKEDPESYNRARMEGTL